MELRLGVGGWTGIVASLMLACVAGGPISAGDSSGPVWMTDFYAAEKLSRSQGKPLIVHFYGNNCGPCRQMDRETLYTPEVTRELEQGHIAVKVNISQHPELQQKYDIDAIPSDLFVAPDGKVLFHAQGFQSKGTYLIFMSRSKDRLERHLAAMGPVMAQTVQYPGKTGEKLPPVPMDGADESEHSVRKVAPVPEDVAAPRVGIDGFCPVTLYAKRTWTLGSPDFVVEYQGQTFYLSGTEERDEFRRNPKKYAPKLRGCDPVLLSETNEYVPGSAKYGAYFDGELFLFETADSRKKFKTDPTRFSKIQHVMRVDEEEQLPL